MAAYQYIYTMKNVAKIYPGGREIMKNITLAFLPGAKIGVLGINGAGKSTLLKIMAGLDQDIGGEARAANGVKVGYLSQEPQLDPEQGRAGQRHGGREAEHQGAARPLQRRLDGGSADPDADMDALLTEQAELQEQIDACNGWDLERDARDRDGRAALPAGRRRREHVCRAASAGGSRLCRLLLSNPDMLLLDEPTNHLDAESVAWLERFLAELSGHRGGDHARPLLPGQCDRLDPGARSRPRHPLRGQLFFLAGSSRSAWRRRSREDKSSRQSHA